MKSLKARITEIVQQSPLAALATVCEDGKPWVRYVVVSGQEDMSIRFATYVKSRKVAQISANPQVHLTCGVNGPGDMRPYLQVEGSAEVTTAADERHGFWKDSLSHYFKGPDDPNYGVVIIRPCRIELCTPGAPLPEVWSGQASGQP